MLKNIEKEQVSQHLKLTNVTFPNQFIPFLEGLVRENLIGESYKRNIVNNKIIWEDRSIEGSDRIVFETEFNPLTNNDCAGDISIIGSKFDLEIVQSILEKHDVEFSSIDNSKVTLTVKFQDTLNPKLFENDLLFEDVSDQLYNIAIAFFDFLDLPELKIEDVTITGSNANFNYNNESDIDIHLLVNISEMEDVYGSLLGQYCDAQRKIWKSIHTIELKGMPVELYIQDTIEEHVSTGVYSILSDEWLTTPKKIKPNIDSTVIQTKFNAMANEINDVIESGDHKKIKVVIERLIKIRKAGLADKGEYSVENIVFKLLRNEGYIDKLNDKRVKSHDNELSTEEEELEKDNPWTSLGYSTKSKSSEIKEKKTRVNLNVPYSNRESAKRFGCKWDPGIRKWYIMTTLSDLKKIPPSWR